DTGEYHADTRAAFPARLPAAGVCAGGVSAADAVDGGAVRDRARDRGTAHLVLAAAGAGAADAGDVQHGSRADPGPGRRGRAGCQPADTFPAPGLALLL